MNTRTEPSESPTAMSPMVRAAQHQADWAGSAIVSSAGVGNKSHNPRGFSGLGLEFGIHFQNLGFGIYFQNQEFVF